MLTRACSAAITVVALARPAAAVPAAPQAPTQGAAIVPPKIAGAWSGYGAGGGGSGGFADADIIIRQSGTSFTAEFTDIDWSAPPGTAGRQHRITGVVGPTGVRLSGQATRARFEANGTILRFPDGSFWLRKPTRALATVEVSEPPPRQRMSDLEPRGDHALVLRGHVVQRIAAGPLGGGAATVTFEVVAPGIWAEHAPGSSEIRSTWRELKREDWSVYLRDETRDVTIQLDLIARKVFQSGGSGTRQELFAIEGYW